MTKWSATDGALSVLARWETNLWIAIAVVLIYGTVASPAFMNAGNLLDQARPSLVLGLLSLGMFVVILTGEIDLSVTSSLGIAAVSMGLLFDAGIPLIVASIMAVLIGAVIGCVNGLLVARLGFPSLIVTLGMLIALRGVCFLLLEDRPITGFPDEFTALGNSTITGTSIPWALVVLVAATFAFAWLVHWTLWGRWVYFVGANQVTARFSGVPVTGIKFSVFVISGACAGLAAVMLTSMYASVRADSGDGMLLGVLTVVLLGGVSIFGGRGTLVGVISALILVALLRNAMGLINVPAEIQELVVGLLLIAAVAASTLTSHVQRRAGQLRTPPSVGPVGEPAFGKLAHQEAMHKQGKDDEG